MNRTLLSLILLVSFALTSGCAKVKSYKSEPIVLADGTVIEYTTGEFTNPWGQNAIIMEAQRSAPTTRPAIPPMTVTATAVSTDRGIGANVLPSAVTGTAYVLGKAVENQGNVNNVTKVNASGTGGSGGSATGGSSESNSEGGHGGNGGTGGQGGKGGGGGSGGQGGSSSPNVRMTPNVTTNTRTVVNPTVRTTVNASPVIHNSNSSTNNNSNSAGASSGSSSSSGASAGSGGNHGGWPSPDDYDHR